MFYKNVGVYLEDVWPCEELSGGYLEVLWLCEELVGVAHTNQMRTCVDFEEIRTKATAPH